MKLWPALWPLLALLAKVESPALRVNCNHGEYHYSGQCCTKCPAGTYVDEHCTVPRTLGICMPCRKGKGYTEYENGLDQCLSCDECKSEFRMVRPCTRKSNTECQCKEGYYCPSGCEVCIRCKTKCPEGKVIVHKCNATTDIECGSVPPESPNPALAWGLSILFVAVFLVVVISIWGVRKCLSKKDEEKDSKDYLIPDSNMILNPNPEASIPECSESRNELTKDAAIGSVQSNIPESNKPHQVMVKKSSSSEKLKEIYFGSSSMVRVHDRISLMRKSGLPDNDIDKIIYDNPNDTDEQYYQMLKTLQYRFGIDDALCKLLDGLWHMKLNSIYDNLLNKLLCNDIITLETKD